MRYANKGRGFPELLLLNLLKHNDLEDKLGISKFLLYLCRPIF